MIPNYLDHYVEQKYPIIRYMDDSIIFVNSYDDAVKLLNEYINIARKLGIVINFHKSKIISIKDGFKYCKWVYLFNNNRLVITPHKSTIIRQRRKLNKLINLYNYKIISKDEINSVFKSFKSYISIYNGYKYIKYLNNIFHKS